MARILLIDDEADLLRALTMIIKSKGHEVAAHSDAVTASKLLKKEKFDVIISDIRMQPMDGLQLLDFLHQQQINTPIVMLTAHATLDVALQAIKRGAFDFITKPFKPEALLDLVQQVLEQPVISGADISLDESTCRQWLWHGIVAQSHKMKELCACLERIGPTNENVLILGEEGTGKRLAAETIHALSPRANKTFLDINCSALNEKEAQTVLCGPNADSASILKKNEGGTVLLENIDALPVRIGQQLANIMQSGTISRENAPTSVPIDVRLLASCRELTASNNWILPLTPFTIALPSLRERIQDLLPAICFLIHKIVSAPSPASSWTISTEAYNTLAEYIWPKNVDELTEVIKAMIASSKNQKLTARDLPAWLLSEVTNAARPPSHPQQIEELRGKSFRDYVKRKQVELKTKKLPE